MSATHTHDVQKEVKIYLTVFVALGILTVITVAISKLHFGLVGNITVALIIATIKASLVACYFMHLISEKQLIYAILGMTGFFFICMIVLFIAGLHDPIMGTEMIKGAGHVAQTIPHSVH